MSGEAAIVHSPDEADEYFMVEGCFILESWNSPDDPAVSIARARVEPGVTTRLHRLAGIVERYLILTGQGVLEVGGRPPREVGVGDVVYIPAGCSQRIRNPGEWDLVFLAICSPRFEQSAYRDIDPAPLA